MTNHLSIVEPDLSYCAAVYQYVEVPSGAAADPLDHSPHRGLLQSVAAA